MTTDIWRRGRRGEEEVNLIKPRDTHLALGEQYGVGYGEVFVWDISPTWDITKICDMIDMEFKNQTLWNVPSGYLTGRHGIDGP